MKNILARIYFFYMALLFAVSMILVWLVLVVLKLILNEEQFAIALHKTYVIWMGIYMPLIFCPVKVIGKEHFIKGENYVVAINHNSFMDVPVSAPGIPNGAKTLAKIEISKVPFFGYIYKQGSILIDRNDRKSRFESVGKMKTVLEQGYNLCLYPEGTRNKSEALLAPFKDGAFKIALENQKDIIPGVILGTKYILHPNKKMYAWPHAIEMHFLERISVSQYQPDEVEKLKDEAYHRMKSFIEMHKEKLS